MLYSLFHQENMIAIKLLTKWLLIWKLTKPEKHLANFLSCIMLQELLLSHARLREKSSNSTDRPSETSFKKPLSKREDITAKSFQKLISFLIWMLMKEIRFAMLWKKKALALTIMSWDKDKMVISSISSLKDSLLLRKKKEIHQLKKSLNIKRVNISEKSL